LRSPVVSLVLLLLAYTSQTSLKLCRTDQAENILDLFTTTVLRLHDLIVFRYHHSRAIELVSCGLDITAEPLTENTQSLQLPGSIQNGLLREKREVRRRSQ
jgi:hypothetical protein